MKRLHRSFIIPLGVRARGQRGSEWYNKKKDTGGILGEKL